MYKKTFLLPDTDYMIRDKLSGINFGRKYIIYQKLANFM